jgi:nucleotide-binding universal stress UspA family protein
VAAVDPDPMDPPRHALAVSVLETASVLAGQTGATLHVVCAWSAFAQRVIASHASRADVREYRDACRAEAEHRLNALMSAAPTGTWMHLLEGQPDAVISTIIAEHHATLVVLGTVGRTGLAGLIMGNTAERVLREVRCAVLALKPEGFAAESPEGGQKAIQLVTK